MEPLLPTCHAGSRGSILEVNPLQRRPKAASLLFMKQTACRLSVVSTYLI